MTTDFAISGAQLFDGERLIDGRSVLVQGGRITAILPEADTPAGIRIERLHRGTLAPGFVDLQVNGGGGVMFPDQPAAEGLERIAKAHAGLGTTSFLATLITDTQDRVVQAVDVVANAIAQGLPGVVGLHLEGPHLDPARRGAHDPALIRPMEAEDLAFLIRAAERLPCLVVTLAPEAVSPTQISVLSNAGVIISLGHSACGLAAAHAAMRSGASLVTHLFNAMSPLGHREPGLVGAALEFGGLSAGVIADAVHVHPTALALACRAKSGPGEIFVVTDAMASAGTDMTRFMLGGREICRTQDRLTLADGTLAGAHVDIARSLRVLTGLADLGMLQALRMATSIPARVAGLSDRCGQIAKGRSADLVHLDDTLRLTGVWQNGIRVPLSPPA